MKMSLGKHMKSSPLPDTSTCFPSAAHARNTNTSQLPSKAAKKKCVQRLFTRSSPGDQSSCGWPPKIIWMPPETTTAEGAGHSFKKTCWRGGELNYIILYPIQNNSSQKLVCRSSIHFLAISRWFNFNTLRRSSQLPSPPWKTKRWSQPFTLDPRIHDMQKYFGGQQLLRKRLIIRIYKWIYPI